jgi:hypothetical protein
MYKMSEYITIPSKYVNNVVYYETVPLFEEAGY